MSRRDRDRDFTPSRPRRDRDFKKLCLETVSRPRHVSRHYSSGVEYIYDSCFIKQVNFKHLLNAEGTLKELPVTEL